MSLIKCRRCGEMFSDSYKTCPFCEEDDAYYGGRVRKRRSRRAEAPRRKAPSILGPVVVLVLILLVLLVVWLLFGEKIKDAIGGEKPPVENVTPTPDPDVVDPVEPADTISLNRAVLALDVDEKAALKVNEETAETCSWSSSNPTVATVSDSGEVTALAAGNAVITAKVGDAEATCSVTVKAAGDSTAPVICEPTSCMTAPVFAILPSAAFAFCSFETVPLTLDVTPAIGPVRLSIMFIMRDSRNTDSKLMLCLSPPNKTMEATLCS